MRLLESRFRKNEPITLLFADGSTREIHGRGYFLLDLLNAALRGDLSASQAAQLELIRKSVSAREPDGAHLIDLTRVMLTGPAGERPAGCKLPLRLSIDGNEAAWTPA